MKKTKTILKNMATIVACFAVLSLMFSGCKKADENLSINNKKELTQTAYSDEETTSGFTFTAKNSWTINVKESNSSKGSEVSWITLFCNGDEIFEGEAGKFTISIKLEINETGKTRAAKIEILSGTDVITISVTQKGITAEEGGGSGGGDGDVKGLTINNLPDRPGQGYDVKVFKPGTVLASKMDWLLSFLNGSQLAYGTVASNKTGNTFPLVKMEGSAPNPYVKWTESGTFPVVLYDTNIETTTWWKIAEVKFSNGIGTVDYNKFEALPW
jgi:hypothetical protein